MTDGKYNSREIALELVTGILEQKKYSHLLLQDIWKKYPDVSKQDRAFITRLTEGTVESVIAIDYILDEISTVKVKKLKPVIRSILRMGIYQIYYMEVPDSAACNESVKLAERHHFSGLKGFVNGVLRTAVRKKETWTWPEGVEGVRIRNSIPSWMMEHFIRSYGMEKAIEIAEGFKHEGNELCVRFVTTFFTEDEIVTCLEKEGVSVRKHPLGASAWLLSDFDRLDLLDAYRKGMIYVQDYSAMMAVGQLEGLVKEDAVVLDLCAAPGGKSLQMADMLKNKGHIYSRDLSERKVSLIDENVARLGFANIHTKVSDATAADPEMIGKVDVLIADLPCSGLGIIAKKPDIRYNITPDSLTALASLQRKILKVSVPYLKPDGYLMYSTCTLNPEENEAVVEWLQKEYGLTCIANRQYFPKASLCDGFYAALLKMCEEDTE